MTALKERHVKENLKSVTTAKPCPICGGGHKCSFGDGGLILCGRRSGSLPGFVDLGPSRGDPTWNTYRVDDGHASPTRIGPHRTPTTPIDWPKLAAEYARNFTAKPRAELAANLWLPVEALDAMPLIGWRPDEKDPQVGPCWTFPEVDGAGRTIGINRRPQDPAKLKKAMPRSNRGLTVPVGWRGRPGPVFLVEGASDTLALAMCGLSGVGRPNNKAGVEHLAVLLQDLPADRDIVVLGEHDQKPDGKWPGREGADHTAAALADLLGRPVHTAYPPDGYKDCRDWVADLVAGAAEVVDWLAIGREVRDHLTESAVVHQHRTLISDAVADPTTDRLTNFVVEAGGGGRRSVRKGRAPGDVMRDLLRMTGDWPRRVENVLFAVSDDQKPRWIESSEALFAFIGSALGPVGGLNPVEWGAGTGLIPKGEFFEHLRHAATGYDALELVPHEPTIEGRFYLHPDLRGGDGSALADLLSQYTPSTPADRDLLLAFLLTLVWGGPPGARPVFVFTGADDDPESGRGVGKTTVARHGADLVGGHVSIGASDGIGQVKTRLLSPDARTKRLLLLDNLKTPKFSWGDLEGLITDSRISGHRMYAGEGSRPNTLIYCVTLNGVSMSRDMAQRSVIVKLGRPPYKPEWEAEVRDLISKEQWAILGDLVALLRSDPRPIGPVGRWGEWERCVLARVSDPQACQLVIRGRQAEVDEDKEEEGRVRSAIADAIRSVGGCPESGAYRFDSPAVVEIVARAKGEKQTAVSASTYLKTISLPELRKAPLNGQRYWGWIGPKSGGSPQFDLVRCDPQTQRFSTGE